MALLSHNLGKTITTSGSNIQIFGVPFNPYIAPSSATGLTNITNTYDLSGLQYGHEVVCAYGTWDENGGHYISFRKGSTELFTRYYSGYYGQFVYIGIDYDEIMANGTDYYADFGTLQYSSDEGWYSYADSGGSYLYSYLAPTFNSQVNVGDSLAVTYYTWVGYSSIVFLSTATIVVTSKTVIDSSTTRYGFSGTNPTVSPGDGLLCFMYKGKSLQVSHNFTVTNMPSVTEASAGYIWVEGANICFVGAEKTSTGYKHTIKHDGSIYSTGKTPGMIWVDTTNHGKICYVDSSGNERKTYTGDINGSQGNSETIISGRTPGMMWVSTPGGNYGYLTFIGYDGNGYRIMNGNV